MLFLVESKTPIFKHDVYFTLSMVIIYTLKQGVVKIIRRTDCFYITDGQSNVEISKDQNSGGLSPKLNFR